ncbi:hypothetical protein ACQP1O_17660 [Nocardia sp. CA-151230]|uniref:hypothetical protein n=1 Tax=Nocardia sp. CA-151230 TaxID=3239982 RepID=UPI003D941BEB
MAETVTGLTQEDSGTIGFVLSCLFNEAIEMPELRRWCEHVIITNEIQDIPQCMFDLVSVDDDPGRVSEIIEFAPDEITKQEDDALYGIAFQRGRDVFDPPLSPAEAQRTLLTRPDVLQRFRAVFPFIELST